MGVSGAGGKGGGNGDGSGFGTDGSDAEEGRQQQQTAQRNVESHERTGCCAEPGHRGRATYPPVARRASRSCWGGNGGVSITRTNTSAHEGRLLVLANNFGMHRSRPVHSSPAGRLRLKPVPSNCDRFSHRRASGDRTSPLQGSEDGNRTLPLRGIEDGDRTSPLRSVGWVRVGGGRTGGNRRRWEG
jgi:hypothetical protein